MKIFRLFVAFTFVCFALSPAVQAVSPAPDGCYPGFTTAEGCDALNLLTGGEANTGVGWRALFSVHGGNFNTGVGAGALVLNTADSNTAIGTAALLLNTTGIENTANGTAALELNDSGSVNSAFGALALFSNTGSNNTAIGDRALLNNTSGGSNTALGQAAMLNNHTGSGNVAIGLQALGNNASGGGNIAIGNVSGAGVSTANGVICIGNVSGVDVDNTTFISGIWGVTTQFANAIPVLVDEAGQLGTVSSSERFKKDIKPIDSASEAILALKPVSFEYKSDKTNTPQFGLIAEEVEKVNPALVVHDKQGRPYTVLYDKVNAMLLNEFLKEHRKVEALEAAVTRQHKDFEAVVAELKGQIQKVSAQLEVSKSAPQTVLNISNAATVQQSRQRVRVFRSRCQRHRKRGSLV